MNAYTENWNHAGFQVATYEGTSVGHWKDVGSKDDGDEETLTSAVETD
jgi:hypothetical protein